MMSVSAWRTIMVGSGCHLSWSTGQLKLKDQSGTETLVSLWDVQAIMIVSPQVSLTSCLVSELQKLHIRIIFCNERHLPIGEFVGYYDHHATPARLVEQIRWKKKRRKEVWNLILFHKLTMQYRLLRRLHLKTDDNKWDRYIEEMQEGDCSNREGQAARLYFNTLLGNGFQRRRESPINAALNYGYAILCSTVTQAITRHGYHPSLGIAHRGKTNAFNFSYDLLEPFRPFVDEIVFRHGGEELDKTYKKELIGVTQVNLRYREKYLSLSAAVDQYVLDITKMLNEGDILIYEMDF